MDGSSQSHGSGSGTAQKIMGWLRRKSIVKHGNERPQFDQMEQVRYASPSPVPNGSTNPRPMSSSTHGDGSVSAEDSESNPSGSTHGNTLPSVPVPTTTTSVISPIQALEEGKDPTLAALIQALPPNWTDAKLKVHSGAVELSSLSSRHPAEIMFDIKKVVLDLGMEIRSDNDFKIKCVRRKRKHSPQNATMASTSSAFHAYPVPDDNVSVMSSNLSIDREAWVSAKGLVAATASVVSVANSTVNGGGRKKNGIRSMFWRNSTSLSLSSSPPPLPPPSLPQSHSQSQHLQHLQHHHHHHHHQQHQPLSPRQLPQILGAPTSPSGMVMSRENGSHQGVLVSTTAGDVAHIGLGLTTSTDEPKPSEAAHQQPSSTITTIGAAMMSPPAAPSSASGVAHRIGNVREPLYGEETIDSGDEIRFSIELCRIKNLHGLYSVDIRRMKGNLWTYKFLYHAVLNTLDLQGKGGYIAQLPEVS
ncbi:hypothetical protein BG005_003160 [Podila minutissima]|nr:hypothetical protein BG005_003160 [Podila minutissima]